MFLLFLKLYFVTKTLDCGSPVETGYLFTSTTATTYGGTSSVSCADGYNGTASPNSVTCEASGSWTSVSGCKIKGTRIEAIYTQGKKKLCTFSSL